jgi:hypothetical protein
MLFNKTLLVFFMPCLSPPRPLSPFGTSVMPSDPNNPDSMEVRHSLANASPPLHLETFTLPPLSNYSFPARSFKAAPNYLQTILSSYRRRYYYSRTKTFTGYLTLSRTQGRIKFILFSTARLTFYSVFQKLLSI